MRRPRFEIASVKIIECAFKDALADVANRNTVRDVAQRMAGDAGETVARDIAKRLLGNLPADTTVNVTGQQLDDFANGKVDVSAEIKNGLANYLHAWHAVFYAKLDKLRSAYDDQPKSMGIPPQPYVNPDPKIAAAQAMYLAALAAARPPELARTTPLPPGPSKPAALRPGFV